MQLALDPTHPWADLFNPPDPDPVRFAHRRALKPSSISQQVIGFDASGALLNSAGTTFGTSSAADVVERAVGIITLLDLCGEERYLKTTLYTDLCVAFWELKDE